MRLAIAFLLLAHGAVHFLGVLKFWRLADVPSLTGWTALPLSGPGPLMLGGAFLASGLLLLGAAALLVMRAGPWWLVAAVGVALSQAVILFTWADAKAGSVANLLLLLPLLMAWADARFQRESDVQAAALFARADGAVGEMRSLRPLSELPPVVRRWLRAAGADMPPVPRTLRLRQRGAMRAAAGQPEMAATALQYFRVDVPEFLWRVRTRAMYVLPVVGRDSYVGGHGRMVIALGALVRVADAADDKIDQGALLRYLAETVWFPAAARMAYMDWSPLDERSARATMTWAGVAASADFTFDDQGRVTEVTAQRYLGGGPEARLERWQIIMEAWETRAGCQVPVRGQVRWNLPAGDFTFYRWELDALEYDPPGPYAEASDLFDP